MAENDKKANGKLKREADKEDVEANEINNNQTLVEKEALEDPNGLVNLESKIEESDDIKSETVERHVLYIAYYPGLTIDKKPLVSTTAGIGVLEQFANDVVTWNTMRVHGPDQNAIDPNASQVTKSLSEMFFDFYPLPLDVNGPAFWRKDQSKRCQSPKSVILSDNKMDRIIDDVRSFLTGSTRKWYIDHGVPVRRSFLFYAPPRNRKDKCDKGNSIQIPAVGLYVGIDWNVFFQPVVG